MKSKVALTKGDSRQKNIEVALRLIEHEIDIEGKSNIFIKVNLISTDKQLAATHVDAVRSLLRFLRERYSGKITVGESTLVPAHKGYTRFGYLSLASEFDVKLVDLNQGEWIFLEVYDAALRPIKVRFSKQVVESDYRIVIGPPKTHSVVIVTLSIKNLVMGSLYYRVQAGASGVLRKLLRKSYEALPAALRRSANVSKLKHTTAVYTGGDKQKIHQGYPVHNLNLYLLAAAYAPHLSVIDGYIGMEGDGPIEGDPVHWGVAIASQDPVAADCLAAQLMGFNTSDIGYLWYCQKKGLGVGEIGQMEILGLDPKVCYHRFRPPSNYEAQKGWPNQKVNELLQI